MISDETVEALLDRSDRVRLLRSHYDALAIFGDPDNVIDKNRQARNFLKTIDYDELLELSNEDIPFISQWADIEICLRNGDNPKELEHSRMVYGL